MILDELTQGLDPAARRDVWSAVAQLRDAGTTVLLVTHELDEAEALCDTVVVMRAGRVLDAGAPAELVARHAGGATVRFSWPECAHARCWPSCRPLPGVGTASVRRRTVHACTATGRSSPTSAPTWSAVDRVPADLTVEIPNLESALLGLLDGARTRDLS